VDGNNSIGLSNKCCILLFYCVQKEAHDGGMMDSGWTTVTEPLFPWCNTLNRIMQSIGVPQLLGPMVFIASDYGGSHKSSKYEVFSVVYVDAEASSEWEARRRHIRQQFMGDGRRMSFKRLGDRQRQKAIGPFLWAAEALSGVCVSLVIRKSLRPLHGDKAVFDQFRKAIPLQGKWRDRQLERMMRITHLVSFLTGGLSRPGQHIYWISDQDDVFADKLKSADSAQVVSRFTSHYVKHPLGELGVGTTALDEGDRFEEDLAAIPDLVAGATAELATQLVEVCGGCIPHGVAIPFDRLLVRKVELLSDWLYDDRGSFKRVIILFEKQHDGSLSVCRLDMH